MQHILLIGDEDGAVGASLGSAVGDDVPVILCSDVDAALAGLDTDRPAFAVLALVSCNAPHAFAPLVAIKRADPDIPVVVVAPRDDIARAQALKLGAADYIARPFDRQDLAARLWPLLRQRRVRREAVALARQRTYRLEHQMIFDNSARMENVRRVIQTVAHLDCTVLIRGESGTGKELVARALAEPSLAQGKPFVKVNCAALPAELLEAELFGYERGAFTGAVQRKLGKFEFAHQGTIFLDEIGEMSPSMQAKVLQVLQDGEFSRLGGTHDTRVDVRILAATHRDLEQMIANGQFREDLFFRLNVISITLPPLRERPDSVPLLTDYFLRKYSEAYKRPYSPLPARLLDRFMEYPWPGNIRELENLIQRMVILGVEATAQEVAQSLANPVVRRAPASASPSTSPAAVPHAAPVAPAPLADRIAVSAGASAARGSQRAASLKDAARIAAQQVERDLIIESLRKMRWNRKETARLLGVSYKTLLAKIRENGLDDEVPEAMQDAG
jgi:DNA-binding NtrC family response regulator